MMKKKASRMISPPAGCREELQIPPSRDDGGGGYRRFRGVLIGCLGFLHRWLLIGEEARREGGGGVQGAQPPPRGGPGLAAPGGCGRLGSPLRLSSGLRVAHGKILTLAFVP